MGKERRGEEKTEREIKGRKEGKGVSKGIEGKGGEQGDRREAG